ncbi:hypothetical protein [Rhodococcus erythropolis]|uniref:hypothetical protein n=1 Tax=Rhodococcus erythropolis TaxID=1833 RepID=UPI0037FBEAC0
MLMVSKGGLIGALAADWREQLAAKLDHPPIVEGEWLAEKALAARLFDRWSHGVIKGGGRAPLGAGCDLRRISDGGADFIGSYLQKSTYDVAMRLGAEVAAGGETKTARTATHLTPFEVLRECSESVGSRRFGVRTPRRWEVVELPESDWGIIDLDSGEVTAVTAPGLWPLWHEWEQGTRGRRQVEWSRRRKDPKVAADNLWNLILDSRGETAAQTEETVAGNDLGGEILGEISRAGWYQRMVWRPSWLVEALEVAESGDRATVTKWMDSHRVEYTARQD